MSIGPQRPRRIGDTIATVTLLVVHMVLAVVLLFFNLPIAMSTDNCAYVECGDEQWIGVAMFLATWVNAGFLLADIGLSTVLLTKRRMTFVVPLIGCVSHLGLFYAAFAVASLAGPVTGS
jgi:hypothetical protein